MPPKMRRSREALQGAVEYLEAVGFVVAGSYRREKATVGDLDLLVRPGLDFDTWYDAVAWIHGEYDYVESRGGDMKSEGVGQYQGNPLNLNLWRVPSPSAWAGMLLYATGPFDLNIMMRAKAKGKGLRLSQYGLFTHDEDLTKTGIQLDDYEHEESIFQLLDIKYLTPVERETWRDQLLGGEARPQMKVQHVLSSDGVTQYMVELSNGKAVSCECKGFQFRNRCRHLAEAERMQHE